MVAYPQEFFEDERIKSSIEDIDPITAEIYLKTQKNNRSINPLRVSEYADRMDKKQWLIGQPIAFDEEGCLIDGQHRLKAVIKHGKAVKFLTLRGFPSQSASVFDLGQKRTIAQIAKIQGVHHSRLSARNEILNAAMIGSSLKLRSKNPERNLCNIMPSKSGARSPQTMIHLMLKYSEGLDFAIKLFGGKEQRKAIGDYAAVKGAIFRAYYNTNHLRLEEFMQVFHTGFPKGEQDFAAMALRNFIAAIRSGEKRVRLIDSINLDMYKKTEAAILNFQAKNPVTQIRGSDYEEFPLADFD